MPLFRFLPVRGGGGEGESSAGILPVPSSRPRATTHE